MTGRLPQLALLLEHGRPADLAAVLARLSPQTRRGLLQGPAQPFPALLAWALTHATRDELTALAGNERLDPRALTALAEHGDPAVAARVYPHERATTALRRRILDVDPLSAELRDVVLGTEARDALGPALDCRHPELAAHAAEHVRRCPDTPWALHDWLRREASGATAQESAAVRNGIAATRLDRWTDADWAEFTALHAKSPLNEAVCGVLAESLEFPPAVALALIHRGGDDGAVIEDVDDINGDVLIQGLNRGAFTAAQVVRETPYAAHLLRTFQSVESLTGITDGVEPPQSRALRAHLTELVRERLGTDPARWRAVLAHLRAGEFPGTLPQLLDAACHGPDPDYRARPWPHVQQVSSSPFTHLLRCADPAALSGILGALNPHDLGELAHYDIQQPLPDALVDAFLEHASPECVANFVPHHAHHDQVRDRLLRRGDPVLNAALLRECDVPSRTWYTIASGPAHPEVTAVLRGGPRRADGPDPLRYAVHTRDADLIHEALRLPNTTLTAAHQITGCRRLVELGRGAELAALAVRHGPLEPLLATVIRTTPARGGTDALAERLAALDREQFRHDLEHSAVPSVRAQLERDEPPLWDDILTLLRENRLPGRTRDVLAEHPDCPEPVAALLLELDADHTAVPLALARRSRAYALLALARQPVIPAWMVDGELHASLVWSIQALRAGTLDPADLLALGRPAHAVLRLIRALPHELGALPGALAAEAARHHPDAPDVWAVTAALLDDFAGTVPELLATAVAAAAPVHGVRATPDPGV